MTASDVACSVAGNEVLKWLMMAVSVVLANGIAVLLADYLREEETRENDEEKMLWKVAVGMIGVSLVLLVPYSMNQAVCMVSCVNKSKQRKS